MGLSIRFANLPCSLLRVRLSASPLLLGSDPGHDAGDGGVRCCVYVGARATNGESRQTRGGRIRQSLFGTAGVARVGGEEGDRGGAAPPPRWWCIFRALFG